MRDGLVDVMRAHLSYDATAEWMTVPGGGSRRLCFYDPQWRRNH